MKKFLIIFLKSPENLGVSRVKWDVKGGAIGYEKRF